ncbi:VOC family protein [Labedaea rhizosphaerae]|uniref:Putative enzyme related to lactoylglutathione lyase n=1 Tax=Labedaea rhizosphaerae TaxID=598644 RepID=A0A4R6RQA8_LABRH|nr:VOC family protein [Labedaea rhizosphaerae]TDP88969.1 putative enzyme related to lactoylglutathione lyase [Labedaea rhizosphaerae]
MQFVSVRVITDDVARLVEFYERATGIPARWATAQFAELVGPACTLAIGATATTALFAGAAVPAANESAILEFLVDDVDAEFQRLADLEVVQEPTTMPWGNRSLLLRDPDGNLVNLFTPVTPQARARLSAR